MKTWIIAAGLAICLAGQAAASTFTFADNTPRTVGTSGAMSFNPFYTDIVVSGLRKVTDLTVSILGVTHTNPEDLYALLVGPTGQSLVLMRNAGGTADISNVNLTFSDAATRQIKANSNQGAVTSGTYQVSRYGPSVSLPAPAPVVPNGNNLNLSAFDGTYANGTWRLYMFDDKRFDGGSIRGWSITIEAVPGVPLPAGFGLMLLGLGALAVAKRRGLKTV